MQGDLALNFLFAYISYTYREFQHSLIWTITFFTILRMADFAEIANKYHLDAVPGESHIYLGIGAEYYTPEHLRTNEDPTTQRQRIDQKLEEFRIVQGPIPPETDLERAWATAYDIIVQWRQPCKDRGCTRCQDFKQYTKYSDYCAHCWHCPHCSKYPIQATCLSPSWSYGTSRRKISSMPRKTHRIRLLERNL